MGLQSRSFLDSLIVELTFLLKPQGFIMIISGDWKLHNNRGVTPKSGVTPLFTNHLSTMMIFKAL